ncbi:hypothetical protein [Roseibium sp.]|uniref:hypothetical protein n=1 Tax=Roseibium sp. TaxID=1936156 RepID=UPI003BACC290
MINRLTLCIGLCFGFILSATSAQATPHDTSCGLLDALGSNNIDAIESSLNDAASSWLPESKAAAAQSLTKLAADVAFNGGTVYQVTELGDDLVEHLVVLRLSKGDVHGMVLRYTWSPEGLSLTGMDYKQKLEDLRLLALSTPAVRLSCDG